MNSTDVATTALRIPIGEIGGILFLLFLCGVILVVVLKDFQGR